MLTVPIHFPTGLAWNVLHSISIEMIYCQNQNNHSPNVVLQPNNSFTRKMQCLFAYIQCDTPNTSKMIYVNNIHQYVECLFKLISCDSIFCSKYFNLGSILVGSIEVKTQFNTGLLVYHALIDPETLHACFVMATPFLRHLLSSTCWWTTFGQLSLHYFKMIQLSIFTLSQS